LTYLSRYEAGEHEQVWREISPRYWKEVQSEPFFSEALEVARATMGRVRQNIELLVPRLETIGYAFGYSWAEDPPFKVFGVEERIQAEPPVLSPPLPDIQARFERLEAAGLRLPLSLRAWYEVVGAVNFVGTPPNTWPKQASHWPEPDPLRVDPLDDDIIEECLMERRLIIAPDEFFKYYTSGGGPYYIELRAPSTDGQFEGGWLRVSFVDYLRIALSWGGLPGIGRWHKRPEHDIAFLTDGLLDF
jgi:hypothetical protein